MELLVTEAAPPPLPEKITPLKHMGYSLFKVAIEGYLSEKRHLCKSGKSLN